MRWKYKRQAEDQIYKYKNPEAKREPGKQREERDSPAAVCKKDEPTDDNPVPIQRHPITSTSTFLIYCDGFRDFLKET